MAVDLTIHGVDESQYDLAGSKFISFPPGAVELDCTGSSTGTVKGVIHWVAVEEGATIT